MNAPLSRQVIQKMIEFGVREFCLCAGARNAPLVSQLEKTAGVQIYRFFEERSAGFFALGRIRESNRPVAVVMTSGTAVAEVLPAVIEAAYQGLPLLIVSADRPRSYRGSGAPQSIEQVGIFGSYAETCWDIERTDDDFDFANWSLRRPLHLNVCFEEPKPSEVYENLQATLGAPKSVPFLKMNSSPILKNVVALVGPLTSEERPHVERFLETHAIPFVAEAPSSLRLEKAAARRLRAPEKTLPWGFRQGHFQSVLRLGGVPTLRFWRDLEETFEKVPVTSCSSLDYTGLARTSKHIVGLENLVAFQTQGELAAQVLEYDQDYFEKLLVLCEKYPRAEASMVRKFAEVSAKDWVYLGNSLPIREWDLVTPDLRAENVWANRGANGIDGQTSSFLGWTSEAGPTAWALMGDLTALYDLSAPWIGEQMQERDRRLVIINNFGGHIFKPMFKKEIFLNRHHIRFQKWAEMWGWDYLASEDAKCFSQKLSRHQVIELLPDEKSTELFQQEWKAL